MDMNSLLSVALQMTEAKSLLSTVRMASRPLGRHFRPKRDLDNLPETYKVAEKSLKIAARLLDIPIVEITKAITGGKSEEFNTYGDLKKFMEKEQKHLRSQAVQETEMTSMTGPS
ncbi:hypothetical protein [Piscirickettsia salmonis]|uniref:hypothetical protein n=1 Tax=Piscirickettsia salmonis TaxID=1238 RepID=UPI0012BADEB7|nr:hypothetical protein [Piscirickettsia salmonis]QGO71956.1 hypothetical protein Psal081_03469 [Piscirickettsia salmonis]